MTPDPLTPSPDSPTPRTDEEVQQYPMKESNGNLTWFEVVGAAFARQLERENAALVKEREELRKLLSHYHFDHGKPLEIIEAIIKGNIQTTATLAERDREIATLKSHLVSYRQAEELGVDNRDETIVTLRAQLAERDIIIGNQVTRILALQSESAETQEKLKEADNVIERLDEDNGELLKVGVALQAHVGECNQALGMIVDCWETEHLLTDLCVSKAHELLSSQPDLPLIEEVREAVNYAIEGLERFHSDVLNWKHESVNILTPAPNHVHIHQRLRQLLTRLNPRK